jgi:uncharacterized SAM-binding protein YcdF (DUF218 family)
MRPVFVLLSKTLDLLLAPLTWALLLVLLGFCTMGKRPRLARLALALAFLGLGALSTERVSRWLLERLERRAVSTYQPEHPYDAVVVLGGVLDSDVYEHGRLEVGEAAERILTALDLLRSGQARTVLLTGGVVFPHPGEAPEAEVLARWFRDQGIAADRIVVEAASRNTHENATLSAPILAAHGWNRLLLVTSAWHAPRALGCFRAVGLHPDLLPVDHRALGIPENRFPWLPRAAHLSASTDALRELAGGLVYRLRGWAQ